MHEQLQQQFSSSSPDIQFAPGNGGFTKIVIHNAAADAEIYLHGAHVASYQPRGGQPVLWMSSKSAFNPDKPIRGGIPICWPWFGAKADDPKAPMHGFARVNEWTVASVGKPTDDSASVTLELQSNDATRALRPHDFVARYTITVGASLEVALETTNRSKGGLILTEALHSYFAIGDIRETQIRGLTGTSFFDKVNN